MPKAYGFVPPDLDGTYERIKIRLEKPTAVTFADSPAIEVLIDSNPGSSQEMALLWFEPDPIFATSPPFPLHDMKLGDWINISARLHGG